MTKRLILTIFCASMFLSCASADAGLFSRLRQGGQALLGGANTSAGTILLEPHRGANGCDTLIFSATLPGTVSETLTWVRFPLSECQAARSEALVGSRLIFWFSETVPGDVGPIMVMVPNKWRVAPSPLTGEFLEAWRWHIIAAAFRGKPEAFRSFWGHSVPAAFVAVEQDAESVVRTLESLRLPEGFNGGAQ